MLLEEPSNLQVVGSQAYLGDHQGNVLRVELMNEPGREN